jgi:hypothetical protein
MWIFWCFVGASAASFIFLLLACLIPHPHQDWSYPSAPEFEQRFDAIYAPPYGPARDLGVVRWIRHSQAE